MTPLVHLPCVARSDQLGADHGVYPALGRDGLPRIGRRGNQAMVWRGVTFRSKAELRFAQELEIRRSAGDIAWWAYEVSIPLVVNGAVYRCHKVDFLLFRPDESIELHEVKGNVEERWRMIVDLLGLTLLREYPNVRYYVNQEGPITWKRTRTATRAVLPPTLIRRRKDARRR